MTDKDRWAVAGAIRRPTSLEEVQALEAEAALMGYIYRFVCPRCGETHLTGCGHLESLHCTLRAIGAEPKQVRLPTGVGVLLAAARARGEMPEYLLEADAATRLGGSLGSARGNLVCPWCGEGYRESSDHIGSDYCLVKATRAAQAVEGFVRCEHWAWPKLLKAAGVEIRQLPGTLQHVLKGGKYGAQALVVPFIPLWAQRVLQASMGRHRLRRISTLRALQRPELTEVQDALGKVQGLARHLLRKPMPGNERATRSALLERWRGVSKTMRGETDERDQ